MEGINTILRIITWVLIPVCALLLWSQLRDHELDTALRSTVAGVVAMVPEGLILLTSVAFMLAAVTLARRQVLVQELPAVEGLARVDVVCLDKTGTLTEGTIVFDEVEVLDARGVSDDAREQTVREALGALADDPNRNATAVALAEEFDVAGVDAHRRGAVLVGPQVERGDLRRPGLVGDGRAGDGAHRQLVPGPCPRRRARVERAAHAGARAQRRRARRREPARRPRRRSRW